MHVLKDEASQNRVYLTLLENNFLKGWGGGGRGGVEKWKHILSLQPPLEMEENEKADLLSLEVYHSHKDEKFSARASRLGP